MYTISDSYDFFTNWKFFAFNGLFKIYVYCQLNVMSFLIYVHSDIYNTHLTMYRHQYLCNKHKFNFFLFKEQWKRFKFISKWNRMHTLSLRTEIYEYYFFNLTCNGRLERQFISEQRFEMKNKIMLTLTTTKVVNVLILAYGKFSLSTHMHTHTYMRYNVF